jgi:DNA replication protein DnaC
MGVALQPRGITKGHLLRSNIGEDYWHVDFHNYRGSTESAKEVWNYLARLEANKTKGIGVMLAGPTGTGKTTLMAILLKYVIRANWTAHMTSLSELVEAIKRSWDTHDSSNNPIEYLKHVDYLGLDDLGKEHQGPSGFSAVTFDNLLRYRMQHRLPTLFTTNLTKYEIASRYGDAAMSLIQGKTKVIAVRGSDFRVEVQSHALRKS